MCGICPILLRHPPSFNIVVPIENVPNDAIIHKIAVNSSRYGSLQRVSWNFAMITSFYWEKKKQKKKRCVLPFASRKLHWPPRSSMDWSQVTTASPAKNRRICRIVIPVADLAIDCLCGRERCFIIPSNSLFLFPSLTVPICFNQGEWLNSQNRKRECLVYIQIHNARSNRNK